jgi:Insertion element 4 transposase N-terminal/Transposase DDE domain
VATDDATARFGARVGLPVWQRMGLGVLAEHIPASLVDQVLADTGRVQQRVRRLPARAVVWFILALALFHGQGYRSVWRELAYDDEGAVTPSASGLSQARRRLGVAPLATLFARLRGPQARPDAPGAFLSGLRLVSWDATTLDVPDSPANAEAFIASRNTRGRGAFPKVRLLTLIECGTHAVIDAVFGAVSEQALARQVLRSLREGTLLLGDRNFPSYRLWSQVAATGTHLLWRVKASTLLPRVATFPDGSWLAVLPRPGTARSVGIWVRVVEYQVNVTTTGPHGATTTRTELFRLITTITDPQLATAAQLADCYRQRWESETGFKALKTHQRGPRQVLRSHDPEGINQELYAYLITYQALRRLMHQAAVAADIDPDRLSFTTALRAVRRFITSAATATADAVGQAVHRAIAEILEDQHERRDRVSPRVVKRSQSPYPSKKHAAQPISTPVSYTINIVHPDPA